MVFEEEDVIVPKEGANGFLEIEKKVGYDFAQPEIV